MSSTQRRRAPVEDEPAGGRRSEADDPAAALRARTRRRLIGATALLVGAVIVLPMLLDTAPRPVPDNIAITVAIPSPARPDDRPAPVAERREAEPAAPVTEPAQPPAEPAPPRAAPTPPAAAKIAVQVAALSTPAAAEELQVRLIKDGFTAYVMPVTTVSGIVHRVRVGPYASRDDAQRAVERLRSAGHKATIVGG
jgi:DedD protein